MMHLFLLEWIFDQELTKIIFVSFFPPPSLCDTSSGRRMLIAYKNSAPLFERVPEVSIAIGRERKIKLFSLQYFFSW
jgi:hypothetical protein